MITRISYFKTRRLNIQLLNIQLLNIQLLNIQLLNLQPECLYIQEHETK